MCFVSTDCLLPNKGVKSLCRQGVNLRCRLTARVVERAKTVFEEADSALKWLQGPNASLGGVTPPSLLDTLGRIEQGVFA